MKREVIITDRAANAIRRIVTYTKQSSLIGGEDAKSALMNRIRLLGINPEEASSRKAKFSKLEGNYRSVKVWDYRIYYKAEDDRVIVLDIIVDLK